MVDYAKTQMITLYLDNPIYYASHPWYQIDYWSKRFDEEVKVDDWIPQEVYFYRKQNLVFYWSRDEKLHLEQSVIENFELIILNDIYLREELMESFEIRKSYYRLMLNKENYKIANQSLRYSYKTVDLSKNRAKQINILSALFQVSEKRLRRYFGNKLIKDRLAIVMVDDEYNLPVGLGLGGIDPIIEEGVIDYIEISPRAEEVEQSRVLLIQELCKRLFSNENTDYITVSAYTGEEIRAFESVGFVTGGKWHYLVRM